MKLRLYTSCTTDKKEYEEAKSLGAIGILTNANSLLRVFGPDMTLKESAQKMLDDSHDLLVFQSVHGRTSQEIVDKALDIYELDPQRMGFKIASNIEGFKAMKNLSDRGIRVVATAMFTFEQAYMAAVAGVYAVSPFYGRGTKAGYDMAETIRNIRALYDRIEDRDAPELLAASIHNCEEARTAFVSGADAIACGFKVIKELCCDPYSAETERSFGAAFARIKGEDVSYLDFAEDDHNYQE